MFSRTGHAAVALRPAALAILLAASLATPALACRGTEDYPSVTARLAAASGLSPERRAALEARLSEGRAMHDRAHAGNDGALMRKSLEVLDEVNAGF